jgi:phosphoribosylformimino-5-aminoimidazole carboxamide ribotide isomerase
MIIIPAIDIKDGLVVRLTQGKFNEATIYSRDPEAVAKKWEAEGARLVHVVDLDGAQAGEIKNWPVIEKIIKAVGIRVQVGGGIRHEEDIQRLFELGAKRVVLGTKAVEDKEFIQRVAARWQENVLISIDTSSGKVAQKGWTSISTKTPEDLDREMQEVGVRQLVFTDIARDGTMAGPNLERIKKILAVISIPLIVAGGISSLGDIKKLLPLRPDGLAGIIVGKALYEGSIDLQEAIKLC